MTSSTEEAIFDNVSAAQLQMKSEKTEDHHVSLNCSLSSTSLFVKSENGNDSECCSHSPKRISKHGPSITSLNEHEVCVKEEIIEIDEVTSGDPVKSYELSIPIEGTNDNKDVIIKTLEAKTGVQNIANLVFMMGENGPSDRTETCDGGNELKELTSFRLLDFTARTTEKGSIFFKCGKCEFETISGLLLLKQHYKKVHFSDLYRCELCKKLHRCEKDLRLHRLRYHSSRIFSCSKCSFSTTSYNTLGRHLVLHHKRYLYCDDCKFKTTDNKMLVVHKFNQHRIQSKNTLNIHLCTICNKVFNGFVNFEVHQRIHTGKRPFSCDLCHYKASRYHNLVSHKRKHLQPLKHFKCLNCRMTFVDQKTLDDHFSTIHMIHRCSICSFRSSCRKELLDHKKFVHRNNLSEEDLYPFQCEKCLKRFTLKRTLTTHKNRMWCKLKLKSGPTLNQKSDEGVEDLHSKKDLLHGNEITKEYLKPFQCHKCLKSYTIKGTLTRHKKLCCKSVSEAKSGGKVKDSKETVIFCRACNEQFPTLKVLHRHLKYCKFNL